MSSDLSYIDRLTQRYERSGTSLFIRTYLKDTLELVNEFEFTGVVPGAPIPIEVQAVARSILSDIARLGPAVSPVGSSIDASGATVLAGAGGGLLRGPLVDGEWFTIPSLFRLRITGTGTVVIDAKDSLGNITTGVASYTVSGATDQIEFPYAGDDAVMIRATLTGTTAEVI